MRELVFGLVFLPVLVAPAAASTSYPSRFDAVSLVASAVQFRRAAAADCFEPDPLAAPQPGTPPQRRAPPRLPDQRGNAADLMPSLCLSL